MLDAFFQGLILVFQWPAIGYLCLGVLIGVWLGAVPGLGGVLGLVILLPFTFGMEPVQAFALLLGMYAVTTTSDTIASVMLGIPGTAASQATILDGYPLAQKGEAQRAFGAAFTVSAFGGVFGALLLAATLPLILPVILAFGNPEIFALGILGLSMVGSLAGNSILKGLLIALFGLLISSIGYGETDAVPRYWLGFDYMLDGLPIIPVVLGLFAIPELMELAIKDVSISRVAREQVAGITIFTGIRDAFRHWWLALRCAMLGTYIGILPGLGGAIVDWLAYGHALQSAKDKSGFGKGDIRGVIAPEAANNAIKGGALIPTVAFGIPGSLGAAILMSALLIQGLRPGPSMLTSQAHVTFSMVWAIVVANILAAGLLMIWSNQLSKIAFIRGHLIVPGVILFVFMGAWLGEASIGDWVTCLTFGTIGFLMKRGGWPRPPLVLALILGGILENALNINVLAYQGYGWLMRPIVLGIVALTVLTLILSVRGVIKTRRGPNQPEAGEGTERNHVISLLLSTAFVALFTAAILMALDWPPEVIRFPLAIAIPAVAMSAVVFVRDATAVRREVAEAHGLSVVLAQSVESSGLAKAATFLSYLLAMLLIAFLVGQIVAICLFIAVYLWRWGGYGWRVSLGYAGVGAAFLYGFYDQVMHIFWLPSPLGDLYQDAITMLTAGLPSISGVFG